jgi:hypothetical protein
VERAAAGIALLLTLVAPSTAQQLKEQPKQQPITSPSNQAAQPSAPDKRGNGELPLAVKILPSPKSTTEAEKEERDRKEQQEKAAVDKRLADDTKRLADKTDNLSFYTGLLAVFTLFLFFVSVVQAGFFLWQLLLIKDSAKDTTDLAKAAKSTAEANKLAQRAYLSVEPQGIMPSADKSEVISHISIKNVGHLPARNVAWFVNVTPSQNNELNVFPVSRANAKGSSVIFPETSTRRGSDATKLEDALRDTKTQEKLGHIYVWGAVYYDNGFGDNCWTKFCHRYPRAREIRPEHGGVCISSEDARYHEHGGNDAI